MNENPIVSKSKSFAIRIIRLYKYLTSEKKEFVISKQILKSGTSIGANIREWIVAISKPDFISKLQISLKEAHETQYWLELLVETEYICTNQFDNMNADCKELIGLLTAILKSSKQRQY